MNTSKTASFLTFAFAIILFGCGGSGSSESGASSVPEEDTVTASSEEMTLPDTAFLVIEGNDLMQYNLDKLVVTEGQIVKLTLKHVGQMSIDAMGHNWVLLLPGTDKSTFGMASVSAKETDYIPQDMIDRVVTNTKVVGGGEETSIVFEAPKIGYYDFICTFPGHWGVMQGSFVVQPK